MTMNGIRLRWDAPHRRGATTAPPAPPPTSPSGQDMPLTAPAGWTRYWAQDFDRDCSRGSFLATYCPSPATFDAARAAGTSTVKGDGFVNAYPTTYHDTRSKNSPVDGKYGVYDPGGISCSGGVMALHIWWDASLGQMRVAAPAPKLSASGTWGDLGSSRRTVRARCILPLNTIKVAWLDWPANNSSTSNATAGIPNGTGGFVGGDGENDFPEQDPLTAAAKAKGFTHRQNAVPTATGTAKQIEVDSTVNFADGNWHTWTTERITGSYNTTTSSWVGQSWKCFVDGVQVGSTVTQQVPMTPMRWVLQTETTLSTSTPLDQTVDGIVEVDWITVDVP